MKKALSLILVVAMLAMALVACGGGKKDPDPVNTKTGTFEEMVTYLTAKGFIAEGTTPVDINVTEGYHKDNTGEAFPIVVWADQAKDYGGLWLFWWDTENPTDAYGTFENAAMNGNALLYMGGAAVLQAAGISGNFAIAFAEDYAKADDALAAFNALPKN